MRARGNTLNKNDIKHLFSNLFLLGFFDKSLQGGGGGGGGGGGIEGPSHLHCGGIHSVISCFYYYGTIY